MTFPSVFYKYAPPTTGLIVLSTSKLRWSSPRIFNDSAEFQRMPRFEPTLAEAYGLLAQTIVDAAQGKGIAEIRRLSPPISSLLKQVRSQLSNSVSAADLVQHLAQQIPAVANPDEIVIASLSKLFDKERLDTTRVFCVTTECDNHGLWENYADKHTGVVLGFRHIVELGTPLLEAHPVTYSDLPPIAGSGLDFLLYGYSSDLPTKTRIAITCTKTPEWSYEREWRAITRRPDEIGTQHGDYPFLPEELESVTLGWKASADLNAQVIALVNEKYPRCKVFRMQNNGDELSRLGLNADIVL